MEEKLDIEETVDIPMVEVAKPEPKVKRKPEIKKITGEKDETLINCLRNERIVVRHIPKENGMISNPKHVLYGGMAETATRTFVVPRLSSGMFVDVLTNSEKAFLEDIMGLEENALSIYKRENNFWDDSNENSVAKVILRKQDNYLDLSNPEDYIRYKILLANKNFIAPSLQELEDRPKATYQFVIIANGDENKAAKNDMSNTMRCYKEYGKIEDNVDIMSLIIETIDGRTLSPGTKKEFMQTKINNLIQANPKLFLKVVTDPLLEVKALIKRSINSGIIAKRGDYYYLVEGNVPMCELGEEPTFNIAAKYLSAPKQQTLKFSIEEKLKA